MQKFRQHNKIFVQACNWGQNAVKYSLTYRNVNPNEELNYDFSH